MRVLLLGLGRANLNVARYLIKRGYEIYLYEENLSGLSDDAKMIINGGKIKEYQEIDYNLVITSPGFPDSKPIFQTLRKKGFDVIDETEFTYNNLDNPQIIAVTGTNGKSTTVALINSILSAAGISNFLGGNIAPGLPFSSALFEKPYDYYVIEISSFQLMRIKNFRSRIAVLTNISTDHLNWHKDINEYINAKKRIFMNQMPEDFAILNYNDKIVRTMEKDIKAQIIFFGEQCYEGAWLDGVLHFQNDDIIHTDEIPLLGLHNWMNVLAAIAVGRILRISDEDIKMGIKKIKPLPHRLENVGIIDGIRYINNSMSTNEAAAIASFQAVAGNKIVIAGGREKGDRCKNYLRLLVEKAKAVVILGENAKEIAEFFDNNQYKEYTIVDNMQEAIDSAKKFAGPGDIIMLNPGFASFSHFRDFQERGDAFKNGVLKH